MATCAHCAEELGWRQIWRGAPCAVCHLAVEPRADGRRRTWATEHGQAALDAPRERRTWFLLVAGAVITGAVSLIPTWGLLTSTLVPLVQLYIIERNIGRFHGHLGFLHAVTFDFYSGLALVGIAVVEGIAGLLLPVAAPVVTVPIFLAAWFMADWYVRAHLHAEARGQLPSLPELGGLAIAVGLVVLPPILVLGAVVISLVVGVPS